MSEEINLKKNKKILKKKFKKKTKKKIIKKKIKQPQFKIMQQVGIANNEEMHNLSL